jgi:hypothetical protein
MRKVLILTAALVLCAGHGIAQQGDAVAPAERSAAVHAAPAPTAVEAPAQRAPSLFVSTEDVRSQVVRAEQERTMEEGAQVGNRNWWYLVAAIAVGVVVALVVLD